MYKTIDQVWDALKEGKTVNWKNSSYKVYIEAAIPDNSFQRNHFSFNKGCVLSVRCVSNHFGSIIDKTDLKDLY